MNLTGTRELAADRQTVWDALLDRDVLMQCVPGCTEMTGTPEDGFEATVVQKVGPVKATFKGKVTFSDIKPTEQLTLSGEGKGGAAGFAKGGAKVHLSDMDDGGTRLDYEVEANVGGKLAQLGSRIIDSFAGKMANQFFQTFQDVVAPEAEESSDEGDEGEEKKGWLGRIVSGGASNT